jgi:hypothetical protein
VHFERFLLTVRVVHATTELAEAAPAARRVAMLVDTLRVGGAERIAVEVACALDRTRFEPFVVVTRFSGPLAAALDEADIEYAIIDRKRGFAPDGQAAAVTDGSEIMRSPP